MKFVMWCEKSHSFAFNQVVVRPNCSYDQKQGDATKICVVRPNIQPRPSVKGAIWSDFYCRTKLVASVKQALKIIVKVNVYRKVDV